MIRRIWVAKRKEVAETEVRLAKEWREELGMNSVEGVRIWHRYDVEGASAELFARAKTVVFAEPPVDEWTEDWTPATDFSFAVELQPGQYDQRADSAEQCLRLLDPHTQARVKYATVYEVAGALSPLERTRLKEYVINPVETREASAEMPTTLQEEYPSPEKIAMLEGFTTATKTELQTLAGDLGLAMDLPDLACIQEYFAKTAQREPTITELRVLDTYWSDHCRHTTFATTLSHVEIEEGHFAAPIREAYEMYREHHAVMFAEKPRPETLMDMATLAVRVLRAEGKLQELDESEEINACTIRIEVERDGGTEPWLLLFKNETHNHPTEIEPFGGAATCLGGCIRDPLSGRAYVYQAMRITGSADPRQALEETLAGKLPQRVITTKAAAGYSSYGNQIGLATGEVKEYYHPGFVAKRMEVGAVVAAAPAEQVQREIPQPGDVVVLVGGRTGRDGCGGATGSSKEHGADSLLTCGAEVQKGNAPTERKLQCLFRRPEAARLIRRCNDFGAGGVAVAVGELAPGLDIDLDAVPKKYAGLDGTEIAISESQERMAVVLSPEDLDRFIALAAEENLEATVIARVTEEKRLVMRWRGDTIVDIEREFLDTNGAAREATVYIESPADNNYFATPELATEEIPAALEAALSSLNTASQQGLAERFDSTIGAGTVLMPFGGKRMVTPVDGMVAKIPVLEGETNTVSLMTHGYDPYLAEWSPFHGAWYAVWSSLAKITALGGNWRKAYLSLQEYFEKLGTAKSWGKPTAALLGAFAAQTEAEIGAIGGKDSMSGTFMDLHVPPTLLSFAVAPGNAATVVSPEWKHKGNALVLLETPLDEYGMPDTQVAMAHMDRLTTATANHQLAALTTVGRSGIAASAAISSFGNDLGVRISTQFTPGELFAHKPLAWIAEMTPEQAEEWAQEEHIRILGILEGSEIIYGSVALPLADLLKVWQNPLAHVFPIHGPQPAEKVATPTSQALPRRTRTGISIAKPSVLIPVMPGTNCEVDTARAFAKAGAEPEIIKVRNLTETSLEESVQQIAQAIERAQIIAFPGGFSAGDEPEGSGKFIATLFRHPLLVEKLTHYLENTDGLILGVCNGFQALVKLGLLPYGKVTDLTPQSPTLTYNTIGRHVSRYVTTRVTSTLSPWLMYTELDELHRIAVSHGEGRFIADAQVIAQLAQAGQIATCYTDEWGTPSMDPRDNPNGSVAAIEGITDPTGRIFGKMGHSERVGSYVAKNIPEPKEQPIFRAGVEYFTR